MKRLLNLLVLFLCFLGHAQNDALFNEATKSYNEGKYDKAIADYQKILKNGEHSAALYYNLGNCYYKLNQIAPSIYNYEKALLLSPNDSDIRNNLAHAQNMTLDAIDTLPETAMTRIYRGLTGIFTFDQWAYTAVFFILLFVLAYIAFHYFQFSGKKRIAFIASMLFLLFAVASVAAAYLRYNDYIADHPAIVFPKEVTVNSEPNNRSQEAFKLHEGAKVNVLEKLGDWNKISLADGKTGWIPSADIKLIKDF
ncbi:tetratricopeptide repeat protein [Flavobacteriaceae bacterium F89]|uniref:Tetratricopeptide repeat protein n=1 Tax=Cerina litoralis TaxID=2874477 RepID=A0AAE3ES49_9FLAO|nr:tetratricopeptide repeat protein [Cerina litoralis]MCG2459355.1 tetratricopeptide repeat protein [Cerina litoralis]